MELGYKPKETGSSPDEIQIATTRLLVALEELLAMPVAQLVENKKQFDFHNLRQARAAFIAALARTP
jgi:hypothetical protein